MAVLILRAKLESMLQTVSNSDSTLTDIAELSSVQTGLQVIPTSTPIALAFFPSNFLDTSHKYLRDHLDKRLGMYETEEFDMIEVNAEEL